MDAQAPLKFREGGRADAAALSPVLAEAVGSYRDWAPPGWSPAIDLAARLMREAVAEARRQGYSLGRLWTPRDNPRARAFYRREGWRETGAERQAPDIDLQLVEYRRRLDRSPGRV